MYHRKQIINDSINEILNNRLLSMTEDVSTMLADDDTTFAHMLPWSVKGEKNSLKQLIFGKHKQKISLCKKLRLKYNQKLELELGFGHLRRCIRPAYVNICPCARKVFPP